MKVVLDSNVLLAAFATRGICEAVFSVCLIKPEIAVSEYILDEVQRHLTGKFKMPATSVRQRVLFLRKHAEIVVPKLVDPAACPDRGDLPILGTVLAAAAACLVTGDRGLLSLKDFKGVSILSPREFHERHTK